MYLLELHTKILLNLLHLLDSKIHECVDYVYLIYYDIPSAGNEVNTQ